MGDTRRGTVSDENLLSNMSERGDVAMFGEVIGVYTRLTPRMHSCKRQSLRLP